MLSTVSDSFANDTEESKSDDQYKVSEPVKISSGKSKKKNKIKENQKSVIWTEDLTLQDFNLLPDSIQTAGSLSDYDKRVLAKKEYEKTPSVFSVAISYGLLLIDFNEIEKARFVWERALKDFYANESVTAYKAWFHARTGKFEEAKNVWLPIAKSKIDRGVVGFGSGIWLTYHTDAILGLYLIKDNLPESERQEVADTVNTIIGAIPQNQKFAAALIADYLKSGQLNKAAEFLAVSLKSYPDDPVLITLLGVAQLMTNHYDDALALFNRANEINPRIPTNHIMKARALFALNREKESFEELEIAMKLDPDLNIADNKKKKYLAQKSYMISKKLKKENKITKETEESKG